MHVERFKRARKSNGEVWVMFYCPGCAEPHQIRTQGQGTCWEWNGDFVFGSFSPSHIVHMDPKKEPGRICHSYIREGKITYLDDSWHDKKGQVVEIPAWDAW
jgi:hypothetical protein